MRRRSFLLLSGMVIGGGAAHAAGRRIRALSRLRRYRRSFTIREALAFFCTFAGYKLRQRFHRAGVAYPPKAVRLVAIKHPGDLELWARDAGSGWRHIHTYPILAASGTQGPKLREGDGQVPEGIYHIVGLNPNSAYHLSLKLDFPNTFDRRQARRDGRTNPGSDIYIHGKRRSKGCLAMGDRAIEELFALVAETGPKRVEVIIAPYDFRLRTARARPGDPPWVTRLYRRISQRLSELPVGGRQYAR